MPIERVAGVIVEDGFEGSFIEADAEQAAAGGFVCLGLADFALEVIVSAAHADTIPRVSFQQFGKGDFITREGDEKRVLRAATGERPVIIAARDGTHCGAAVKNRWNFIPSAASWSSTGVLTFESP